MTLWDQITDDERDRMVATIVGALATAAVPEHLRGGLVRYFSDGILPGGFLQAVLCQDVRLAGQRAASMEAILAVPVIITFLFEHAPPAAWGSRENLLAWTTTPNRLEV